MKCGFCGQENPDKAKRCSRCGAHLKSQKLYASPMLPGGRQPKESNLDSATGAKKLVLAGGVSANSVLRRECEALCRKRGVQLYLPPLELCGDNAAMVGAQGYYEYLPGKRADASLNARATMGIEVG